MSASAAATEGVRARKVRENRQRIVASAWKLFLERGFNDVTVEEIADVAEVSPRTVFRYFDTKEAILYADLEDDLVRLEAALADQPTDLAPIRLVRNALWEISDTFAERAEQTLLRARLASAAPSVFEYQTRTIRAKTEQVIVDELDRRNGGMPENAWTTIVASAAVGAVTAAWTAWFMSGGQGHLRDKIDTAFDQLPHWVVDDGTGIDATRSEATPG